MRFATNVCWFLCYTHTLYRVTTRSAFVSVKAEQKILSRATDLIQVLSGMIESNEWTTTNCTATDVMVGGTELNVCKEATSLLQY